MSAFALFFLAATGWAETNGVLSTPARVIIVENPLATEAFHAKPEIVQAMVDRAMMDFARTTNVAAAWRTLVSTQDVVGIKVFSTPGPNSGTRIPVVASVIEGLLRAGMPARQIIVWDKYAIDLRLAGFFALTNRYGVRVEGSFESGYDEKTFYEIPFIGQLNWGDSEFGKKGEVVGRKSFVSKLLARDITKIINVTPLLSHHHARVSGNLYGLAMGSVDNTMRFESDTDRLANAVPEIYALQSVGDKVVLNIVDALICQYQGSQTSLLHYSTMLNQIRVSRDPVALDALSIQELDRQLQAAHIPTLSTNLDLYQNAALLELGVSDLKKIQLENVR